MSISIFCCYAHEDEKLLNKLKAHLSPLQKGNIIDMWYDRDIRAGTEWGHDIDHHLNTSPIILLLVSPDFMNSDYCYGIEMKRALERHEKKEVCVIPIILRHVHWRGQLGKLQALPISGKPITDRHWRNMDEAFNNVVEGILKVIEDRTLSTSSNRMPQEHTNNTSDHNIKRKDRMVENQFYTKRITSSDDEDVYKLINLYEMVMPDNYRSPATDIIRWLDEYQENKKNPDHTLEEYWLIGKFNNQVVSFFFFQYYLDSKFLFISYLGIDEHALHKNGLAAKTVLAEFQERLQHELQECRGIVYEIATPVPNDTNKEKINKWARKKLFKMYAKKLGFAAYELGLEYVAPKISTDPDASFEEERLALSYIPLKKFPIDASMPKDEVIEILLFVYLQVYGDSYNDDPTMSQTYKSYLSSLLDDYIAKLPERVPLLP